MGQDMEPQLGILIKARHALLREIEMRFQAMEDQNKRNLIINVGAYASLSFFVVLSAETRVC
jgi:hypothetical protein